MRILILGVWILKVVEMGWSTDFNKLFEPAKSSSFILGGFEICVPDSILAFVLAESLG
jgi:hypothetical protein